MTTLVRTLLPSSTCVPPLGRSKQPSMLISVDSPEEAVCPTCGGVVTKRKRRKMSGQVTYFYRHETGVGDECPRRYRPMS